MQNEELTILGSQYNLDRLNRRARIIVNIGKYNQQIGRHTHKPCDDDYLHRFKTFFIYRGPAEKAMKISHAADPLLKGIGIIFPVENKVTEAQLSELVGRGWIVLDERSLYVVFSNHTGLRVKDENCNQSHTAGSTNLEPVAGPVEEASEEEEEPAIELTDIVVDEEES